MNWILSSSKNRPDGKNPFVILIKSKMILIKTKGIWITFRFKGDDVDAIDWNKVKWWIYDRDFQKSLPPMEDG